MKILPVTAELFHAYVQTDGGTNRHEKSESCSSQFFPTLLKFIAGRVKVH